MKFKETANGSINKKKFVYQFKGTCTKGCTPYEEELKLDPPPAGKKLWEPSTHAQRCPYCNESYVLHWTITERNYVW